MSRTWKDIDDRQDASLQFVTDAIRGAIAAHQDDDLTQNAQCASIGRFCVAANELVPVDVFMSMQNDRHGWMRWR
jgi:hypothetical protein